MALLDTSALIDLSRSRSSSGLAAVLRVVRPLIAADETLCTSRLNEAEFRIPAFLSGSARQEIADIESVLAQLVILEFDYDCATTYARLFAKMRVAGNPIGRADVLIAAVAITNGHQIVTRNVRHFSAVPGVKLLPY